MTRNAPQEKRQPLIHSNELSEVTSIQVTIPNANKNFTLPDKEKLGFLKINDGTEDKIEITFDDGKNNLTHDFRPTLQMIFRY